MKSFYHWVKHEVVSAIPAIIYFAIAFNIIHFTEGLILPSHAPRYTSFLGANLGAIIIGKIILIANALPFINAYPNKPIWVNITWKSTIYIAIAIIFQLLDIFCRRSLENMRIEDGIQHVIYAFYNPIFWSIQIWIAILFLNYVSFSELARVMGRKKLFKIFFG